MKKTNFSKQVLLALLVVFGSMTITSQAYACSRWDVRCKIREAANRAREGAEDEARRINEARQQAERQAAAQLADARRAAEQAAALAAQQVAAAKAAEQAALKAAAEAAARLAELAKRELPITPGEAVKFASNRVNLVANTAQGAAMNSLQATASGLTRVSGDINSAFRNVGDELESELKKLNVQIPDVAEFATSATKPAMNELKSFDAYRAAASNNFNKLSKDDIGVIWSTMRSVMEGQRPAADDVEDIGNIMKTLFGDFTNGCTMCPKNGRAGVGFAVTILSPTVGQVPLSAAVSFTLTSSTYLVNGKPVLVAGYTVSMSASAQPRLEPEVALELAWAPGDVTTSKLPAVSLGVSMSSPGITTPYGSYSAGGGIGMTMPDTVFKFFDKAERRKLLATLKDPSRGPAYVVQQATVAIADLKTMVMNPAISAGIAIGSPGKLAPTPPDGGMTLSVSGVIGAF